MEKITEYLTAKTRHFLEKTKDNAKNLENKANLSFSNARDVWKKEGAGALRPNINITQSTQNIKKLMEGNVAGQKLLKLSQNKWFRRSIYGVAAAVGISMLEKTLSNYNTKPVIPKSYERGYDLMNETITDFGSPVKLLKTASKIITPYYSSVRKGIITNTFSVK
jgi:hypothetical protein